jgi:hypothetical protein
MVLTAMAEYTELSRQVSDLSGEYMALRAAFESHREHCATDKGDMKAELKGINGKLWAGLVLILFQFIAIAGYLVVQGPPWIKSAIAEAGK